MTDIKKKKYLYDSLASVSTEIFMYFERYLSYDSAFSFKITKLIFDQIFNELYTSFTMVSKKALDKIQDTKKPLSSLQIANILIEEWNIVFVSFEKEIFRYGERFEKIDDFRKLLVGENLSFKDFSADMINSWDDFINKQWLPIKYLLQTTSVKKWAPISFQPNSEYLSKTFRHSFQRPFLKSPFRSEDHAFLLTVVFLNLKRLNKDFKKLKEEFINGVIDQQEFISKITEIEAFLENEIASKQLYDILSGRYILLISELLRDIKKSRDIASKGGLTPENKQVLFISMITLVAGVMFKKILKNYTKKEKESGKIENLQKFYCKKFRHQEVSREIMSPEDDKPLPLDKEKCLNYGEALKYFSWLNFEQEIKNYIKILLDKIECMKDQKDIILSKSLDVLNKFISRAEKGEFTIRQNANLKSIASTIIYTIIISNENMPKVGSTQISDIAGISDVLSRTYNRYFKHLYPRIKEGFYEPSGFARIRNIISLYLFNYFSNLREDDEINTSNIAMLIVNNILDGSNLPKQLSQEDLNILYELISMDRENFVKYLTDLVEIIRQLIVSSKIYKKIEAYMGIKSIADFLWEKDINFFKSQKGFYRIVLQIFNFLKEQYTDILPNKMYSKKFPTDDYKKIVRSKLKLYVIKNIYNGKYFRNGKGKCPECVKERFIINTDISRLKALEFHHPSGKKKLDFSAKNIYEIFTKNQSNPRVLEYIIDLMESEGVELMCRNHHQLLHATNYHFFQYFINWENLLSLPGEIIFILAKTSVNNYRETINLSEKQKEQIILRLIGNLQKKYIIEQVYGIYCHICGEISTIKFLPSFVFAHLNSKMKSLNASSLYDKSLTCIDIVRILIQEKGAYICNNCHTVFDYKDINLFKIIYENDLDYKTVLNDYKRVQNKITIIQNMLKIETPLDKSINISKALTRYITAIYEILETANDVTPKTLSEYLNIHPNTVHKFFEYKEVRSLDFLKQYIQIKEGIPPRPTYYGLTHKGYDLVKLIYHFRDYYRSI